MNAKKNVLIGKIGKAMLFRNIKISTGGDACMIFYSAVSRMNPEYNFYIGGPNDLEKLSTEEYDKMFPNHNVFSSYVKVDLDHFSKLTDRIEQMGIQFDFALLFNGQCSTGSNIPHFMHTKKGEERKVLCAYGNYAGPYIYVLNKIPMPLFLIAEDPRYITVNCNDLLNRERLIFSQIDADVAPSSPRIQSETDHTLTWPEPVKTIYAGTEQVFLMGLNEHWRENIDIERKLKSTAPHCIVISHGHSTSKINCVNTNASRLPEIKTWILDNLKDTEYANTHIYGKWRDEDYEAYPQIENRFLIDIKDEIADAKYTFVHSIVDGFVTVKPWEMIATGLLPFIHPTYDPKRMLGLPEYLYVKDPQDFINKMRELDANPNKYVALLNECLDCIKPDMLDGSRLNNTIFKRIGEELGYTYETKQGVASIFDHFDKNVFKI